METIKNEKLSVEISEHGAEMQSIKDAKGEEYLWWGDAKYWTGRSPVLFPIVGRVFGDEYRYHGHTYQMKQHGLARGLDFKLIAKSVQQLTFALHDTDETLRQYPFHFNLGITYKLQDNKIHVIWHVENTDQKYLYFQIGGHPAFLVPGWKEGRPLKARLRFDNGDPKTLKLGPNHFLQPGHYDIQHEANVMPIDEHTFDVDTYIFDNSQIRRIELLDLTGQPHVTVETKAPLLGIWSPPGQNAPFVCIEPWYGVADWEEYDGPFEERHAMNRLMPGASFMSEYVITIG